MTHNQTQLKSFNKSCIDPQDFSRAYPGDYNELYDEIEEHCTQLATIFIEEFPITATESRVIIDFDAATTTHYLNAITRNPEIVLKALAWTCHLSERTAREFIDAPHLFNRSVADFNAATTDDAVTTFIEDGCKDYLPATVPVETVLLRYFRTKERNCTQHTRGGFYAEVHEMLEMHGFAVTRDHSAPGRPNIVVAEDTPVELSTETIAGKAVSASRSNIQKRIKQASACCETLAQDAGVKTRVGIFEIQNHEFDSMADREQFRDNIENHDGFTHVFFSDELGDFIMLCTTQFDVTVDENNLPDDDTDKQLLLTNPAIHE
ncbi:hypothetical protein [Salinibaculum rarum]|uniref:hypothetical protein n=1 Tax=Salinibaculum rarum TaxID=3058903 RepID=UPI00265F7BAA|nr:hypothetical protein [Salinibaculum sp. KK48]